ncbi:hypothetical protein GP475_08745 [Corynebacterium poyangense]|uniref:Uncharacterized protein n=1 Tax=Corynebacterium poyangense TaxID=2684405 RepID=A0A7H0SQ89_9CORY|nr:hypothetical protein [Corynebacterium poyangense]QNQ90714.1 hypothetical protein GP475_08745 [Corynebacterium poyangense]
MPEQLICEWIDPRGKVWDLTGGAEGVILAEGQEGLEASQHEHTFVRGESQWAGVSIRRAEPTLKIEVGGTLTGQEYYSLAEEWWSLANSPEKEGILRFTRPDGMVRELRARLNKTPETTWTYDPGAPFCESKDRVEAWILAGSTPYWEGAPQSTTFGIDIAQGDKKAAIPFFGPEGHGWPLYISQPEVTAGKGNAYLTNSGQGPMWVTWRLVGPMVNPHIGVGDSVLVYKGEIAAGEVVVITTRPGERTVIEEHTGDSRFSKVGGAYAPVPVGEKIRLVVSAEGMTSDSAIEVTGRPQYRRPF